MTFRGESCDHLNLAQFRLLLEGGDGDVHARLNCSCFQKEWFLLHFCKNLLNPNKYQEEAELLFRRLRGTPDLSLVTQEPWYLLIIMILFYCL